MAERVPSPARIIFAFHRPCDAPPGGRECGGHRGDSCRLLVWPADTASLAPHRGSFGDGRDDHLPDLLRGDERGVRAGGPVKYNGPRLARPMGNVALGAYRTGDRRLRRGIASASATMTLDARAWLALIIVTTVMCALLFGTAGTLRYGQAWVYVSIFVGASALTTVYLMKNDRALLARRMRGGPTFEKEGTQRVIMVFTSLGFIALLVVPALDRRFGWSDVPVWAVVVGNVLVGIGFYFIFLVYRENTFTAATIEVSAGQKVIATGPYAVVRHPMYASGSLYVFGTPLALGSYWGFLAFAGMTPFLLWRLLDEERILTRDLPGYAEYRQLVRHRLVPMVW